MEPDPDGVSRREIGCRNGAFSAPLPRLLPVSGQFARPVGSRRVDDGAVGLAYVAPLEELLVGAAPLRRRREQEQPGGEGIEAVGGHDAGVGELTAGRHGDGSGHMRAAGHGGKTVRFVDDDPTLGRGNHLQPDRGVGFVRHRIEGPQHLPGPNRIGGGEGAAGIIEDVAAREGSGHLGDAPREKLLERPRRFTREGDAQRSGSDSAAGGACHGAMIEHGRCGPGRRWEIRPGAGSAQVWPTPM